MGTFEIASLPNVPGQYLRKYGIHKVSMAISRRKYHCNTRDTQNITPLKFKMQTKTKVIPQKSSSKRNIHKAILTKKKKIQPLFFTQGPSASAYVTY